MVGATATTNGPEVAPDGTLVVIVLLLQLLIVAGEPFNVTVLEPCAAPNPLPDITIGFPVVPVVAETVLIAGATTEAKFTDTLSNVAVARLEVFPLLTPKPTYTVCPMLIVWSGAIFAQFTPSSDA